MSLSQVPQYGICRLNRHQLQITDHPWEWARRGLGGKPGLGRREGSTDLEQPITRVSQTLVLTPPRPAGVPLQNPAFPFSLPHLFLVAAISNMSNPSPSPCSESGGLHPGTSHTLIYPECTNGVAPEELRRKVDQPRATRRRLQDTGYQGGFWWTEITAVGLLSCLASWEGPVSKMAIA